MSKKHKTYRGRIPTTHGARYRERVTIDARKAEQGRLRVDVVENDWRHREEIRNSVGAALATCEAIGIAPGELREEREHTETTPQLLSEVYLPGESRLENRCHAPRADKTGAPDVTLKAGSYTLTVRLRQTVGRSNMRADELLRASSKARAELTTLANYHGFSIRELGRKQSAADMKFHGGSCDFAITGELTQTAYDDIHGAKHTVAMSQPWKALSSGTDERMPKPKEIRVKDMKRKESRQAALRKQFKVS